MSNSGFKDYMERRGPTTFWEEFGPPMSIGTIVILLVVVLVYLGYSSPEELMQRDLDRMQVYETCIEHEECKLSATQLKIYNKFREEYRLEM